MSGWHEILAAYHTAHARQTGRILGRLEAKTDEALALLRQMQSAPTAPPSKAVWAIEFGRMAGKAIIPQLAPLVWAWVLALGSAMGAMAWAGWRILRGSIGF